MLGFLFQRHKKANRFLARGVQHSCLPQGGAERCSEVCSWLPGKLGLVHPPCPAACRCRDRQLWSSLLCQHRHGTQQGCSQPLGSRASRADKRCERRRKKPSRVNTAVLHPMGVHCSSEVEEMPAPSPSNSSHQHATSSPSLLPQAEQAVLLGWQPLSLGWGAQGPGPGCRR